jgi:hypothetical protein
VTLTLATSRACPSKDCDFDYGTGTPAANVNVDVSHRNAGVYTNNNDWFFERAGWSYACYGRLSSRPGGGQPASLYVDELSRVFQDALVEDEKPAIVGTGTAVAGQLGKYNAASVLPFYRDSPDARFVWSINRVGDTGSTQVIAGIS